MAGLNHREPIELLSRVCGHRPASAFHPLRSLGRGDAVVPPALWAATADICGVQREGRTFQLELQGKSNGRLARPGNGVVPSRYARLSRSRRFLPEHAEASRPICKQFSANNDASGRVIAPSLIGARRRQVKAARGSWLGLCSRGAGRRIGRLRPADAGRQ
jgi:hypothetical protein